ncbi:MAG: PPOX class F420-dependent oxidoreductase [Candidatus Nitrosopolaris sp.]
MDKGTNQITEPVAKLLEGRNFAFVATLMNDGWPQITPTWVDLENGKILVNTAVGRLKQKNISRDDRVAISVTDQSNPYHMVTVRGRVVEQTTEGADKHIDKLARKYLGVDKYPLHSLNEKRIILKIKPERVYYQPPQN